MKQLRRLLLPIAIVCLLIWAVSQLFIKQLPPSEDILSALAKDPVQTPVEAAPFSVDKDDTTYTVTPLFKYSIQGLVVSVHHSGSVFDIVHEMWGDKLNIKDICLIWGSNVRGQLYDNFTFSSGDFTCFVSTDSYHAWQTFDPTRLSNNHILAVDSEVVDAIMTADVGDQVAFEGYLSEYSHSGGFFRSTSTTRLDTGNGACETIFVNSFSILKRGNQFWHILSRFTGGVAAAMGLISLLWFLKDFFFTRRLTSDEYYNLAKDAVLEGKYKKALRELTLAMETNPGMAKYYEMRSALLERLGRFGEAHTDMETFKRLKKSEAPPENVEDYL